MARLAPVAPFLLAVVSGCTGVVDDGDGTQTSAAVTASSPMITKVTWDFADQKSFAIGSDLWPLTWSSDDYVYGGWGDGGGFGGGDSNDRTSIGFARITSAPPNLTGVNLWGNTTKNSTNTAPAQNKATFCGKPESMISVGGVLYTWVGSSYNASGNDPIACAANPSVESHKLARSTDQGASWSESSWTVVENDGAYVFNNFVSYGKDNAGAPGGYVYIYGYKVNGNGTYLARVTPADVFTIDDYEVWTGLDKDGSATWTSSYTPTSGKAVSGNPGVAFYHEATAHYVGASFGNYPSQLTLTEGPELWGPFTVIDNETDWGGFVGTDGDTLAMMFPTKWISEDGKTLWSVSSWGGGNGDALHLIKATLTYATDPPPPPPGNVEIVGLAAKCADTKSGSLALEPCTGAATQLFTLTKSELQQAGKCLESTSNVNHTALVLAACTGSAAQSWSVQGEEIYNGTTGRCLDLPKSSSADGTPIYTYPCHESVNEQWTLTAK